MDFTLGQIQAAIQAQFDNAAACSQRVTGWCIDSRTAAPGDLFIALPGDNVNGHDFVSAAFERGASAALICQDLNKQGNLLRVPDTLVALQQLAQWARQQWAKPIIAVTGSAGKTSTKDIIASLLSVKMQVGKTAGNFNNHIGLPISILRLSVDSEVAVLEMGMNHGEEIRALCRIATPEIGLVTNVGYAHIENFNSIEGVAAAKRELIESLPSSGTAVLNIDDPLVARFSTAHTGHVLTYGVSEDADIQAEDITFTPTGTEFSVAGVHFHSHLSGRHGILNVLAGIAAAKLFRIHPDQLVEAVAALMPGRMRGERHEWNGATVLNDSYNSNPEAARGMLDVLRTETSVRRIAVLGEMRELGHMSEYLHREVGAHAAAAGVDALIGIHGAAQMMVEEALASGIPQNRALFFDTPEEAGHFLKTFVRPGDTVLFKGSRGTHVEVALATMEAQP